MLEGTFTTGKLLPRLRKIMAGATVIKHCDRYTRGIPDFSITTGGRTTWWEVKIAPNDCSKIQAYFVNRMHPVAFVIYSDEYAQNFSISVYCGRKKYLASGDMDFETLLSEIVVIACNADYQPI